MQSIKISKTVYPDYRPDYNEWCKLFSVSRLYINPDGITRASEIMSLWDKSNWKLLANRIKTSS